MLRAAILFLASALWTPLAQCQTNQTSQTEEARTMEAVLSEIRQLRQDLRAAAGAARRAQVIIYRLHYTQYALERATGRLDEIQARVSQFENQRLYETENLKSLEESREKTEDEQQRSQLDSAIHYTRERVEMLGQQEQEARIKKSELEADVRAEQAKWDRLTAELDQIENAIENSALEATSRGH